MRGGLTIGADDDEDEVGGSGGGGAEKDAKEEEDGEGDGDGTVGEGATRAFPLLSGAVPEWSDAASVCSARAFSPPTDPPTPRDDDVTSPGLFAAAAVCRAGPAPMMVLRPRPLGLPPRVVDAFAFADEVSEGARPPAVSRAEEEVDESAADVEAVKREDVTAARAADRVSAGRGAAEETDRGSTGGAEEATEGEDVADTGGDIRDILDDKTGADRLSEDGDSDGEMFLEEGLLSDVEEEETKLVHCRGSFR